MLDFGNGDMNAMETCDVEGERGKKDEAMGDCATFDMRMDHSGEK